LFKHNENYDRQIKNLALKNGSHNHVSYPSDRFDFLHGDLNTFNFTNEDGEHEILERAVHVKNYM